MKIFIIYDSVYGNTAKVAKAMAKTLAKSKSLKVRLVTAQKAKINQLIKADLLVIGSPTHGGMATSEIKHLLAKLPQLQALQVAVFDTRSDLSSLSWPLKLLVKVIGYAAPKMANNLRAKGASLVIPVQGFVVNGKEGPLLEGELSRAKNWVKKMELK